MTGQSRTPAEELVRRVRYVENLAYTYGRNDLAAELHRFANEIEKEARWTSPPR